MCFFEWEDKKNITYLEMMKFEEEYRNKFVSKVNPNISKVGMIESGACRDNKYRRTVVYGNNCTYHRITDGESMVYYMGGVELGPNNKMHYVDICRDTNVTESGEETYTYSGYIRGKNGEIMHLIAEDGVGKTEETEASKIFSKIENTFFDMEMEILEGKNK